MTKQYIDWTKPLEFQETPGFWIPCNLVYESDKLMIVVYEVAGREYEATLDPKKKNEPLSKLRNKKESRAVPRDKWLDLTKPLEGCWTKSGEYAGPIKYVGQMDDASANFPSWFIVRWEEDCEDSEHFLMRGDGKTDIPGLTVRNKQVTSKLELPIKVGYIYRNAGGETCYISEGYTASLYGADVYDSIENYNVYTGASIHGYSDLELVEGPL